MTTLRFCAWALAFGLLGCGGGDGAAKTPANATAIVAPGDAKVGDKSTCPVSGEEFTIAADSPKVEHKGKTYYMCCAGCSKKFASDPEKFLNKK